MGKLSKLFGLEKKGKISFVTDKQSYIAAIVVKATGAEKVNFFENTGSVVYPHVHKNELYKEKIVVLEIPQTLEPGLHSYPFQFHLPATAPNTFELKNDYMQNLTSFNASVKYKFMATLEVDGFLTKDLKETIEVAVQQQQRPEAVEPVRDSTILNVKSMGLFKKGTCELAAATDKNVYRAGETAQIQCEIKNHSKVGISAMRCRLYLDITVPVSYGRHTFEREIAEAKFPGVAAGKEETQSLPFQLVSKLNGGVMLPSSTGRNFECAYRIMIDGDISWGKDIKLTLPINIEPTVLQP
ncbi:hypothetical protein Poli38472_008341 [Pythium oligandrum]|uniref:Arrestin C-terminal-like domain-containing protein n=1 Tax=Pythium oligandrum TaxID=41045 RepID=A0A8K1FLX6_PYTOL|nr:hypothetical protein Poli38472_008341 [Pythium oligandrum]|eukprot:TMW65699.1 hypothetical protein Poli38472_008341 [Pythium oligandrum]